MASTSTRTISPDDLDPRLTVTPLRSLVDWQAIIAGGVITAGMSFLLMSFGSAVGLAISSPFTGEGVSVSTIGKLAIFWFAFTQLYSFAVGSYVAGRLRAPAGDVADRSEVQFRDGISGLVVWAAALIFSALIVASTAVGISRLAANGAGQAVGSVATAAAANSDYLTDVFLRSTAPAANAPGASPSVQSVPDARAEVGRILAVAAARGELTADDKQGLASIVAARSAISQEDALKRVNEAVVKTDAVREDLKRRAKVIADEARAATSKAAFWGTLLMILTGIVAWYAAKLGGRHRDDRQYY